MEPYEKFSCRIHQVFYGLPCPCVNLGQSPLIGDYLMDEYRSYLIPLLGFSTLKVFWVQSGYGCDMIAWTNTMDEHC